MLTIVFPDTKERSVAERRKRPGFEYKAGGTDVIDRVRHRAAAPRGLIHLRDVTGLDGIEIGADAVEIGARATLADLAEHPVIQEQLPVLAEAARTTANPQVRAAATVGGALAQRPRCPYFRDELFVCAKKGGDLCLARQGDHHDHAIFHNEACMAPHPSTLGAALLATGGTLQVRFAGAVPEPMRVDRFFTVDASDPVPDNGLQSGALIESVRVPLPTGETRQRYLRASTRHLADWASAEVALVVALEGGRIRDARVALGGVGRVPLRAKGVEAALKGKAPSPPVLQKAAKRASEGATPGEQNEWKVTLVEQATLATLEEALS